jgi:hypothetical protein
MNRQTPQTEEDMRRQLNEAMMQYQALNQPPQPQNTQTTQSKDYLGEIDKLVSDLDDDVIQRLSSDVEYIKLQDDLQKIIQDEMLKSIRWKVNSNPSAISKMDRLKELII